MLLDLLETYVSEEETIRIIAEQIEPVKKTL